MDTPQGIIFIKCVEALSRRMSVYVPKPSFETNQKNKLVLHDAKSFPAQWLSFAHSQ